ncbi:ABC transporter permease [Streptomyces sp. NPDC101733]|uniref:ABC transporter permease n=1 Tax=unclassified Streptomyces TaxID=2593676 RepID=UPI0037F5C409
MSAPILKGPYRLTLRLHRQALWTLTAAVGAALALLIGLRAWADGGAVGERGFTEPNLGWHMLRETLIRGGAGLLFLPALVGAFVAGPMIARELESGTWRFALSQSTTPRAWLASKVLPAFMVSVLAAAALVGIYRLAWAPISGSWQLSWADRGTYEATGIVLGASCLLGVAVGALVGQLVRRTLVAMGVTAVLTSLVVVGLGFLRWSILPVETLTAPFDGRFAMVAPPDALLIDSGLVTATGVRLPEFACAEAGQALSGCGAALNVTERYADFHPSSHYWTTQLIESGIVLALTAILLHAAFRLLRTRRG